MCLAIYKPADTRPDWWAYSNGHDSNSDSWGFAAVVDGQIVTRCGVGSFSEFREAFEPYSDRQAIIHFRWATHGSKTLPNCHPFMVHDDLAVIHNGVIDIQCNLHADRSDTWHFNELVLKPMADRDRDFFLRPDVIYTMNAAHTGSKFVFLRADGSHAIWNENDGIDDADGHWYSNSSFRSSRIGFSSSVSRTHYWRQTGEKTWTMSRADDEPLVVECESVSQEVGSPFDEDEHNDEYTQMRLDELRQYGISEHTLDEVLKSFGEAGIEALHDLM